MLLLLYSTGIRVVVCTANFVVPDWFYKTQAIWAQDFPRKQPDDTSTSSFEDYLVGYFAQTKSFDVAVLKAFDYSRATVELVPDGIAPFQKLISSTQIGSTPGAHYGPNKTRWGHLRLRELLAKETLDPVFYQGALR